jgi:hypothetical protein
MEITGKLLAILPETTGESAKGKWFKRDIIIETMESYPKKIAVTFFTKERSLVGGVGLGTEITCHVNIESKEYNGKWFTNINAWKYEAKQTASKAPAPTSDSPKSFQDDSVDDLPF